MTRSVFGPSSFPPSRVPVRWALGACLGLAACGGGGSGGAAATAEVPADGASIAAATITPAAFDAAAAGAMTVSFQSGPADPVLRFVREDGRPLGPERLAVVERSGDVVRCETPVLPEVEGEVVAVLEVRGAADAWTRVRQRVRFLRPVAGLRSVDGTDNNVDQPAWGSAGTTFRREVPDAYGDGIASPSGADRPGARAVSNAVAAQVPAGPDRSGATDLFTAWGQFLDHDLDLSLTAEPAEPFAVPVPTGDPFFDPDSTGTKVIPLSRTAYDPTTGLSLAATRRQLNAITSWIDASQVYGSDESSARGLRALDGTGRLRTSEGDLLPLGDFGFVAGDVRVNEQLGLTALHVVFLREHNRIADAVHARNPQLSDDQVYETARRIVGAEIQAITLHEYLPILLGPRPLPPYRGYDPSVDPSVGIVFSTAAFRFGHSMVSPTLLRLDAAGSPIAEGPLSLRDAFFQPQRVVEGGGIEPLLRGLAAQRARSLDPFVIDDLRNFLFGPPGAGGLDLASLNLQRGRDHGLPGYNACRVAMGLPPRARFDEISPDPVVADRLASVYRSPDEVDAWIGGLSEPRVRGGILGELFAAVVRDQFTRARDADRFWFERVFTGATLDEIAGTRLADVIRRTTTIRDELADRAMTTGASSPPSSEALASAE